MAKNPTYVPPAGQDGQLRLGTLQSFYRSELKRLLTHPTTSVVRLDERLERLVDMTTGSLSVVRAILAGCGVDVVKIEEQVCAEDTRCTTYTSTSGAVTPER